MKNFKIKSLVLALILFVGACICIVETKPTEIYSAKAGEKITKNILSDAIEFISSGDVEKDIILTIKTQKPEESTVEMTHYEIIGDTHNKFEKFNKAFIRKYTNQTRVGKLISFTLKHTNDLGEVVDYISSTPITIKLYVGKAILKKEIGVASCIEANNGNVKIDTISDNYYEVDGNYITISLFGVSRATNMLAVFYNNSYTIVIICVIGFLAILGLAIGLKIRKMHKDDPEYYAQRKKEKMKEKKRRQYIQNNYSNQKSAEQNKQQKEKERKKYLKTQNKKK